MFMNGFIDFRRHGYIVVERLRCVESTGSGVVVFSSVPLQGGPVTLQCDSTIKSCTQEGTVAILH